MIDLFGYFLIAACAYGFLEGFARAVWSDVQRWRHRRRVDRLIDRSLR